MVSELLLIARGRGRASTIFHPKSHDLKTFPSTATLGPVGQYLVMASIVGALHRNWQIFISRPTPPKSPDALRFGILGASKIALEPFIYSHSLRISH